MNVGSFAGWSFRRRIARPATGVRPSFRYLLLTGVLIALVATAACGGDGPAEPLADCLDAAGVTGPAVAIRNFAFSPDTLRIATGSQVTWVNCESPQVEAHTTTSDEGVWGSGLLSSGDTFVRTFDEAGTFPYHCVPHPNTMRAVVIVEDGA